VLQFSRVRHGLTSGPAIVAATPQPATDACGKRPAGGRSAAS